MPEKQTPLDAQVDALDERIEQLRPHMPSAKKPAAAPSSQLTVTCPACGAELQCGKVSVHRSFFGRPAIGPSFDHLWFEPAEGGAAVQVVRGSAPKEGWRCPTCGFVGIKGKARSRS
jgi:predicted RNA-binding Zn-ribbon protein involved in translation (DUF1610 family)